MDFLYRSFFASLVLAGVTAACSVATEDVDASEDKFMSALDDGPLAPNGKDEPIRVPAAGTVITEVAQPELLVRFEKDGFPFSSVVGASGRLTNADLYKSSASYKQIADALSRDLEEVRKKEPTVTTRVVTGKNRLFDKGWLTSGNATFDLVGVVGRFDRRDVQPEGGCGEVRFLYRLSYVVGTKGTPTFSRMPFFFNVVYDVPSTDCGRVARGWVSPGGSADAYVDFLEHGALDRNALRLKQIEVNAQVVRVPSENEKDMGGRAEYFLRVYAEKGGVVQERPLENTPDVARLKADPSLRAELLGWITSNVRAIDEGTALMPEKFAAKQAMSFTTFGSVRKVNKLFSSLYSASDVAGASLEGTSLVASPEALLFRLDDMTCAGCHQGRSVAGFHFLGKERGSRTNPLNGLRTHGSPHYLAEQPRREAIVRALLEGRPTERNRALSFDPPPGEVAKVGTHCVLAGDRPHFRRSIDCENGTSCKALAVNAKAGIELGQCLPDKEGFAGLPCLSGSMTDGSTQRDDKLTTQALGCKGAYACLKPEEGTPGGMCVAKCKGALGAMNGPHEICAYGGGAAFDACAMSGNFGACIDKAVSPAPRQMCDEANPCREDYMCQRLEPLGGHYTTTPATKGFCNPTYFIFQMRLDGHPQP